MFDVVTFGSATMDIFVESDTAHVVNIRGVEGEIDLSKVHFDVNLFEEFTKGYLESFGDSITEIEKDNLAFSAILMTYECGMRFLTDYLGGDSYFRTSRDRQNLDRARTQFKLISEMEANYSKMCKIVDKYYNK